MKKIAILSLHLGYGGIERSVASLANSLIDKYEVEIVSIYKLYNKPAFKINENVKITYLSNDIPNRNIFIKKLKKLKLISAFLEGIKSIKILYRKSHNMTKYLKKSDADIIISTRDILNTKLGKYAKKGILKIGWEHNHPHGNNKYAKKIIKSAKKLNYLVLVSEELKKYYSKYLTSCKCVYIPNMLTYLPKEINTLESKRMVSIGRLSPEKGYDDLIKIFHQFSRENKDWTLDIIGDGPERKKIIDLIKKYNLKNRVITHGFRDKDYINKILKSSSIYLMCSHTESFGIVLIEAMAFGIPCIAFKSAEGARVIIDDGVNGYLIDDRSYDEMINKINKLINDKKLRQTLGKNARKTALEYSSKNISKKWIKLLGE